MARSRPPSDEASLIETEGEFVVLLKKGESAARYKATLVARHEWASPAGLAVDIGLWRLARGQVAVQVRRRGGGVDAQDTAVLSSLLQACDWLERLCEKARAEPVAGAWPDEDARTVDAVVARLVLCQGHRLLLMALEHLAGEALSEWDELLQGTLGKGSAA